MSRDRSPVIEPTSIASVLEACMRTLMAEAASVTNWTRAASADDGIHAPHQTFIGNHRHSGQNTLVRADIDDDIAEERARVPSDDGRGLIGIFRVRTRKVHQGRKDIRLGNLLLELDHLRLEAGHIRLQFRITLAQGSHITRHGKKVHYCHITAGNPGLGIYRYPCKPVGDRVKIASQSQGHQANSHQNNHNCLQGTRKTGFHRQQAEPRQKDAATRLGMTRTAALETNQ